jgi:hypothetical protein
MGKVWERPAMKWTMQRAAEDLQLSAGEADTTKAAFGETEGEGVEV